MQCSLQCWYDLYMYVIYHAGDTSGTCLMMTFCDADCYSGVSIGLEMAFYSSSEEVGVVTICAAISSAGTSAQERSVSVTISALTAAGDTAEGNYV